MRDALFESGWGANRCGGGGGGTALGAEIAAEEEGAGGQEALNDGDLAVHREGL
jgi:hypothetical protein